MARESWVSAARSLTGEDEIDRLRAALVSLAEYVADYCNDPKVTAEARRILQEVSIQETDA